MASGLIPSLLAAVVLGGALASSDVREARIDVTADGGTYAVAAVAASERAASGTYTLTVERVGEAGRSRSQQGGAFELLTSGERALSTSRVNAVAGDSLLAELTVTWSDGDVSTDRVRIQAAP